MEKTLDFERAAKWSKLLEELAYTKARVSFCETRVKTAKKKHWDALKALSDAGFDLSSLVDTSETPQAQTQDLIRKGRYVGYDADGNSISIGDHVELIHSGRRAVVTGFRAHDLAVYLDADWKEDKSLPNIASELRKIQPVEEINETEARFKEGDRVWHPDYGHGVISPYDDCGRPGLWYRPNVTLQKPVFIASEFLQNVLSIPEDWSTHRSEECPVKGTNLVEALFTSGKKEASEAEYLPWYHIIAYREFDPFKGLSPCEPLNAEDFVKAPHEEDTAEAESSAEEAEEISDTQEEASNESLDDGTVGVKPEPKFAKGDTVNTPDGVGKITTIDWTHKEAIVDFEGGRSIMYGFFDLRAPESEPTTEPVTPAKVHHQTEQGG